MLRTLLLTLLAVFLLGCGASNPAPVTPVDVTPQIIALERAALDRWGKGDPSGYLEIMAPEITYFDPAVDTRKDGLDAMKAYLEPIRGKVAMSRYDMISPKVQRYGEGAVLTFQLVSYGAKAGGGEQVLARWNSTEVYRQEGNTWKIAHNHWSFIKPELKQAPLE